MELARTLFFETGGIEVNPIDLTSCQTCCNELEDVFEELGVTGSLSEVETVCLTSCDNVENEDLSSVCDVASSTDREACQVGFDFSLIGASYIENLTAGLVCNSDSGGITQVSMNFSTPVAEFEANLCDSCCQSAKEHNPDFADLFTEDNCNDGCENLDRCFQDTNLSPTERLGCAIGYELRSTGETTLGTQRDNSATKVECLNGEIQSVLGSNEDDKNWWEDISALGWGAIGAGVFVFVSLIVFGVFFRDSRKEHHLYDLDLTREDEDDGFRGMASLDMPSLNPDAMNSIIRTGTMGKTAKPRKKSDNSENQKLRQDDMFSGSSDVMDRAPKLHLLKGTGIAKETFISRRVNNFFKKVKAKSKPKPSKKQSRTVADFLKTERNLTIDESARGLRYGADDSDDHFRLAPVEDMAIDAYDPMDSLRRRVEKSESAYVLKETNEPPAADEDDDEAVVSIGGDKDKDDESVKNDIDRELEEGL